jgi:hypothetical protein
VRFDRTPRDGASMQLQAKDLRATVCVAGAALFYALWAADASVPGVRTARATGIVVLVFGFVASATAVIPEFERLMRGSKTYLALTGSLGAIAAAAGVHLLISGSGTSLSIVMAATFALWLIATVHHSRQANRKYA